ncbi:DUF1592 domain-containing protein [Limnoglobus roseus]|uniref:Haem-binding domain-containing protein n=1 Tax=Limnoglobus roseus TaxID=2598579 RepID=A0A5C1AAT8_9BACT|nr:DUF1592 domain-containing protein [Limnoglobus roseus]QEL16499.1 hypothetical protein PX52LOC_03456 [Limnoglobus roseus]
MIWPSSRTAIGFVVATTALAVLVLFFRHDPPASAADAPAANLGEEYAKTVRPLIVRHCQQCHSARRSEGDIDLQQFATLDDARKATRTWQKVAEMLDSEQMPPKESKQPTDADRTALRTWVKVFLKHEAKANAGDPGRVVLRRLSNAEYTYTLRDLTGVDSLQPAREFPVDGAAGEGFTNTGNALVMSPALLTKYLDAAKDVASHAVLMPDGIRFSPTSTRRDWTNEILAQIRMLYGRYTDSSGGNIVNLQGLMIDGKEGGRVPVEQYLRATLADRDAIRAGRKSLDAVAAEHKLSAKYLAAVWKALDGSEPSLLLNDLRTRWRTAKPDDANALAADIARWQKALWKFNSVGHIGKLNGPKAWLEPLDPLTTRLDVRMKLPPANEKGEVTLYLAASDLGDGADEVIWQRPRFVAANRPDLLLRDVRAIAGEMAARRERILSKTSQYLQAAAEFAEAKTPADVAAVAKTHDLEADALQAWLDCLGIGASGPITIDSHFTNKLTNGGGYAFINGWGVADTPNLLANSSDTHVRVPGNMKPHGVVVHPSPKLQAVVGWQSPVAGNFKLEVAVAHAHPECGNGIVWTLEHRRGNTRRRLGSGTVQGGAERKIEPITNLAVQPNDLISLLVGPRDGNHSCDLTGVNLTLTGGEKTWDLAKDVSGDVLAGNPHADTHGNKATWHFYTEPVNAAMETGFVVPKGSLLDRWRSAGPKDEKQKLAAEVQKVLTSVPPPNSPDAVVYQKLTSLSGPLFGRLPRTPSATAVASKSTAGLDPASFGKDTADLSVKAPNIVEVRVPADLVAGYEFVTRGTVASDNGSVQLQVLTAKPAASVVQPGVPIVVGEKGNARTRLAADLDAFRNLFPLAACYTKIVPVDEVVTLTLFYREDHHLARLMLTDAEQAKLDRLWDELHYVSQDALTLVDAYQQLMEFATQDSDPRPFEPLRKPIQERAAAYRKLLIDSQPRHVEAVLAFAERAYRRPLTAREKDELTGLYRKLRQQELPHDEAVRLTLARVFVSPAFLYRLEKPGTGADATPVSDTELASRLSYFLWASTPDAELSQAAAAGKLHDPAAVQRHLKRMLADDRTRRLASEFACQWLHVNTFDQLNDKSETLFPTFAALRGPMKEESVRFFIDFFQNDRSILDLLDADHTFVNDALAKHYGIPGVTGPEWRRIDGVKKYGRGGILGLATTLATQSGASRTSPILRGNWVSEVLLGEKLPKPPKDVPPLPDDESKTAGLTVRQLVEKHTSDAKCSVCHKRIDAYGFALEKYDAIGRFREKDLGDRPIDVKATTLDGASFEGIDGLRTYLLTKRKDAFVRQFCKKLLGYALGRAVQLSDEPLLDEMQEKLKANGYRIGVALEMIVSSKPFREIRGSQHKSED